MLKWLTFKSSVSFEIHALLDKLIRGLKFPTHLSNLTAIG